MRKFCIPEGLIHKSLAFAASFVLVALFWFLIPVTLFWLRLSHSGFVLLPFCRLTVFSFSF
jgi:hypothetical protein